VLAVEPPARSTGPTTLHAPPARASGALNRTLALALVTLAVACSGPATDDVSPTTTSSEVHAAASAVVDGDDLVLVAADGSRTVVATVTDAELLHAEVRPSDGAATTVLALTRAVDRYELRYLSVTGDEASDLYWFPSRLQVDPDSARIADVPPLPVWAPDGSGVAWLEWDGDGTRLRTVGWYDHAAGDNPSDDQAAYAVDEVPLGTQLATWEVDADGTPVLITRGEGDDRWRIRIEAGEPIVALEPSSPR
jgi:hypothetical protein